MPPPLHGVSKINCYLKSELESGRCYFYDYRFSNKLSELGGRSLAKILFLIKHLFNLSRLLAFGGFDNFYFTPNIKGIVFYRDCFVVILAKLFRVNIYLHLHGLGITGSGLVNKILYKLMFNNTSIIHVSETVLRSEFLAENFGAKNLYYLNNSIDLRGAVAVPTSGDSINIAHMSLLRKSKGVDDVIKIFVKLSTLNKDVKVNLHLIGCFISDSYRDEVLRMVPDSFKSNLHLHGFADDLAKMNIFSKCDIFLYPSYDDSFGLVVLEAQKYGLPVVAYDVGSMRQIVNHKIGGQVVQIGDITSLYNEVVMACQFRNKSIDIDFLTSYSSHDYVKRFVEIINGSSKSKI